MSHSPITSTSDSHVEAADETPYGSDLPVQAVHPARTLIGRFELSRRIGAGASGTVYEAFDRKHQANVALKMLSARSGDPLLRFKREFRALQSVRHPNIVSFGELFEADGEWFFTMELLTGVDFRSFVRRGTRVDEPRLRDCVRQLAEALHTLHSAGIVHRDVKPANVVVSHEGRVTLLDFGVVRDESSPSRSSPEIVSFVGTPAYMAPEQISGDAGPPADCYAMGVMLFEALVGKLPFGGKVAHVLHAKQNDAPPAAHLAADGVPLDLSHLAADLLATEPTARPTADEVARRASPKAQKPASTPPDGRPKTFVGRDSEMAVIFAAFAAAGVGRPIAVRVEGESGIGKSSLVQHFIAELRAKEPTALVLTSRCRETEWIPYKAFDGLMEDLSRFMRALGDVDAALLLPTRATLVAQVFPALMQIGSIALSASSPSNDVDAVRQRRRLFAAVRELFARVAERYPLVLFIDDLPWADPDSLALLREILRGPDAPPFLLLATAREGALAEDAMPACLRDAKRIRLGPLSQGQAMELARILAMRSDADLLDLAYIARESEGHPLFIQELVYHAAQAGAGTAALGLDAALAARIELLEPCARELLECVALAARPMTRAVLVRATSLGGQDTYRYVNLLGAANLVRMTGPQAEGIEPFHDRVRQATLRVLSPQRRIKRHRRIAAALESTGGTDSEALAYHFREAGKADRAAAYAERAAAEAERAFAFDQAAHLYRIALDLGSQAPPPRVVVLGKMGNALANAGRSVQAAAAYREAASHATGIEAATCLQKAAEQLFRAGRIDEGLTLAQQVLAALGLGAPKTPWHALASFLFWRCLLAVRGLSFRERSAAELPARDLARIDVSWAMTAGLSTVDPIRGAYFQVRHLRMALAAGEPFRVVRALAMQIVYAAGPGAEARRRSERFSARCSALSERIGDPHGVALTQMTAGVAAYLHGEFSRAVELLDDAEKRLRACPGTWGEIARARRFALSALANLGRMRELRTRVYAQLRDAREHGDLHATTNLRIGHPNLVWLMEDDVEGAREEIRGAMDEWPLRGFQMEHFYALFAETNVDLYAGEPSRARARQLDAWPRLEASHLLRIPAARVLSWSSRARAAIAIAEGERSPGSPLLTEADRLAKRIARQPLPSAAATALLLRAGISAVRGRRDEALVRLSAAELRFEALEMQLFSVIARRCRALVEGGETAVELLRSADAWMVREGIARPEKMADMIAPGFRR